jgi:nucleoside-diphosphate-sugar epimerase
VTDRINRVAVVGGAGYLGSVLCAHLLKLGCEVLSIDTHWFGDSALRCLDGHPGFKSRRVEVLRSDELLPLLRRCNAAIWVAGLVGDPACDIDVGFTYSCNYHSTLTLAHVCRWLGISRFIFASSCSVYGRSNPNVSHLTEESPTSPLSCYAQDKLACERALRAMRDESFHPTILRLSTLFGWSNRMRFDLVVNLLTARACRGEVLEIHGGGQRRPFLHVEDAAAAFATVLFSDLSLVSNTIYNVGTDTNNHCILDVAELVYSAIPSARMKLIPDAIDQRDYNVDFSKITRTIGFEATMTVAQGISQIQSKLAEANGINISDALYSNEKRTRELVGETWKREQWHQATTSGPVGSAA